MGGCSLDRPSAAARVLLRKLEQLLVAGGVARDGPFAQDAAQRGHGGSRMTVLVSVDPDDEIDPVCQNSQAFAPFPERRSRDRSGTEDGRTVMGHTRSTGWSSS
jgi:hypothetical protein